MSSRRRPEKVAYWILAIVLTMSFVPGGWPKINPDAEMIERFANWGYSEGFCRLIGVLEVLGGLLVLVPRFATYGAAVLSTVMLGAIYTHLSTGIGSPATAIQYLLVALPFGLLRFRDCWRPRSKN